MENKGSVLFRSLRPIRKFSVSEPKSRILTVTSYMEPVRTGINWNQKVNLTYWSLPRGLIVMKPFWAKDITDFIFVLIYYTK